jgi:DNA-binding PadR family transcriptional regulator
LELRISARVLLHLVHQPRLGPGVVAIETLTQAGMASALVRDQPSISHVLARLARAGLVSVESREVRGRRQRVRVYQLTKEGETLARHVESSIRERHPGYPERTPDRSVEEGGPAPR